MPSSSPPADDAPVSAVRPRRRRWPWLLGLAVVLTWAAAATWLLLGAASDLRSARAAAEAAREDVSPDALTKGRALPRLREARDGFAAADDAVRNPVVAPLRILPVVGRQLRSIDALSSAAHEVSDAAVDALEEVRDVLADPATGPAARLADVHRLGAAVRTANRRIAAVDDLGPRRALLSPLAEAHDELAEELAEAREALADAAAGAEAAVRLLEGPSRYLVVAANNAEMRAGSGMWLSGGVLTAGGGRLELGDVEPLYDVADPPDGAVPIGDADLADRWGALWNPNFDWRGLMVSPRLPASAELAARMWEVAGREPVDGILVVDPVGLAALVRATGPVRLEDRTLRADEVAPFLLHEQYRAFGADADTDAEQALRRDSLGAIATSAFEALDAGEWSPATLARELADAIAGRHLLAWSRNPVQQRGWVAAGMDGDLDPSSLFVSVLNRGGNKLDWFLQADAELERQRRGAKTLVTLSLRLTNGVRVDGLPRYVVGPPFPMEWEPGLYVGVVTVNVPRRAREIRFLDGAEPVVQGGDGPTSVIAREVTIPPGETREIAVSFVVPAGDEVVVEPSARQPEIRWRYGSKTWQDSSRQVVKF